MEENLEECVLKFISDHIFRRKLFGLTKPGRDGFSVNQIEYIAYRKARSE